MSNNIIDIEDLLLFILSNSNPNMGIKKLNKLAFFLEFTYIFENDKNLTNAQYAAINMGPVIDDYKVLIKKLVKSGKINKNEKADEGVEDYVPLVKAKDLSPELTGFLLTVLNRYKDLSAKQLEDLSHGLDSYNITVHENGGEMGKIIDKELALLDSSLSLTDL
ncbi:SocA family protein [Patescibacteria group bacterium]|nr:SocA family protein [Patescibacteria group bacterium]MBU1963006.1 SocA family protein [Patescibacteria group bacterium]